MQLFFSGCDAEDLMEFSSDIALNPFGAELASLASQSYDTIDDALEDITAGLQSAGFEVDEDDVYGFFSGEFLPSEDVIEALSELCLDEDGELDEAVLDRFLSAAEASYLVAEQVAEEIEDEIAAEDEDYEDYEDYEDEDEDEDEDEYEYYEDEDEDEDGEYYDPETEALLNQVEELTTRQAVTDQLDELVEYGRNLVGEGKLPPIAFAALLGDAESTSSSRFAEFSSVCEEDDLNTLDQLDRIEFCLSIFDQCGAAMDFNNYAPSEYEDEEEDEELDLIAQAMVAGYRA